MKIEQIIEKITVSYLHLSEECKNELQSVSKILKIRKGTVIVREGQFSDKAYFIAEGSARTYYLKDGRDITDWFAFENDFISSIISFFLDVPSPLYLQVLEDSTVLEISKKNIDLLSHKYWEIERLSKLIVTKTMLLLQQRIVSIQFETAQQKYENLLRVMPDITQRVNLTHIASYLGITLETLSRIRQPKNRI